MYAIVDIETTGSKPSDDRITEIAIVRHDGERIIDTFQTLINPGRPIPYFISKMTGITQEMVSDAPPFYEVAKQIVELTDDAVFVAHNVRFDYGFLKTAFADLGYNFQRKTLCTVRLARTVIPGLAGYGLGKLCKSLEISLERAHRAGDDALATAKIFDLLLKKNPTEAGKLDIDRELKSGLLPPQLSKETVDQLPNSPGVYYFRDERGQVLYIGKSKNIRKRVLQHFNADTKSNKSVEFKMAIASVTFELTGTDLIAQLLECEEIKRYKPAYNKALQRSLFPVGIFEEFDKDGYLQLSIKRIRENPEVEPLMMLGNQVHAKNLLTRKAQDFKICQQKMGIQKGPGPCFQAHVGECDGACRGTLSPDIHNARVEEALKHFRFNKPNFFVIGPGRTLKEKSVVCVENGRFQGFGFQEYGDGVDLSFDTMRDCIKPCVHTKYSHQIIRNYVRVIRGLERVVPY